MKRDQLQSPGKPLFLVLEELRTYTPVTQAVEHPEGRMHATWFQASAPDFIVRSRKAFESGLTVLHTVGGSNIEVSKDRAISQTRNTIMQRAEVHGVLVDVICYGRFWGAWETFAGRWLLRLRQPIYELDHMIPVDSVAAPALDPELLASFPMGYRNFGYLQTQLGLEVYRSMPGTRGAENEALMARGRAWLVGESAECLTA